MIHLETKVTTDPAPANNFFSNKMSTGKTLNNEEHATQTIQNYLKRRCIKQDYQTKILIENADDQDAAINIMLETPIDLSQAITITNESGNTVTNFYGAEESLVPRGFWPIGELTITYTAGYAYPLPQAIGSAASMVLCQIEEAANIAADETAPRYYGRNRAGNLVFESDEAYRERAIFNRNHPVRSLLSPVMVTQLEPYRRFVI